MILGHHQSEIDDDSQTPHVGLVLPFGARRSESTSSDGRWRTVARIPAARPTRPSDEPTLELPVVRLDVAPHAAGPALVPIVFEDPRTVPFVASGPAAYQGHEESSGPARRHVDAAAGTGVGVGSHGWGLRGSAWWLAAGRSAGRVRAGRPGDRVRTLLATLVETVLELLVALLRLLIDGVAAIYRIVQRFGTAAIIVSMVLLGLRMIPWAEIASFVHALSAPP